MAFADPQSVTISGTAISLPRTSSGTSSGAFTSSDGLTQEVVSHNVGNTRNRRTIRLNLSKIAANPLDTSRNIPVSMSTYIVLDVPKMGFSAADQVAAVSALCAYLTASTNKAITQLVGGES